MTIDNKTIAARMTDEEMREIVAEALRFFCNPDDGQHKARRAQCEERMRPIYTRLTTPQPKPDDAVTGEDVKVIDLNAGAWIKCGNYRWVARAGWRPVGIIGHGPCDTTVFMHLDDAIAQRDRLVARGELPTVNGRTATRKECGL